MACVQSTVENKHRVGAESAFGGDRWASIFGSGLLVLLLLICTLPVTVSAWDRVKHGLGNNPVSVTRDFFAHLERGEVDAATQLVHNGVPVGESAGFVAAEALLDDWGLVSAELPFDYSSNSKRAVDVVIGSPQGQTEMRLQAVERDGLWKLSDPFVSVTFAASPLNYVQVNDMVLPRTESGPVEYLLLPGQYQFYGEPPSGVEIDGGDLVSVTPTSASTSVDDEVDVVHPGLVTAQPDLVADAQAKLDDRLDECVQYEVANPKYCPFGSDGLIDTADGQRLEYPESVEWSVEERPDIALEDARVDAETPPDENTAGEHGFQVQVDSPGVVLFSGTGFDDDDEPVEFEVECDVDLSRMRVVADSDGKAELGDVDGVPSHDVIAGEEVDTCRSRT